MLRYLTAGESHGICLIAVLEGMPAGLALKPSDIDGELKRRQLGYGRGARMTSIEVDRVQILSGVRFGLRRCLAHDVLDRRAARASGSVDSDRSDGESCLA